MPNRGAGGVSYRYGFNGKETENDVKGIGNEQDYGMRIYDPRLGRFLSVDPITKKYPELTPYQFASNRPIDGIDQDGLEWYKRVIKPILETTFPATRLITTKEGREIARGAAEHINKTVVDPIKKAFTDESPARWTTLGRTTIADPQVATQSATEQLENAIALFEGVK